MNKRFKIRGIIRQIILIIGFGIFSHSAFSKTIYANVSEYTTVEPVMIAGTIVSISENGCRIKVMSESYRNDTIELNGKCPNNLRKGKRVFGTFDGRNFVFMRRRGLLK